MAEKRKASKKADKKATARVNYKSLYEEAARQLASLRQEIEDVNMMLDAIQCPPNCGTINGRMVEFARKSFRKYGHATNPGDEARRMLQAVAAPVGSDGPVWSVHPRPS